MQTVTYPGKNVNFHRVSQIVREARVVFDSYHDVE